MRAGVRVGSRRAFIDSSAYLAAANTREGVHRVALQVARWLAEQRWSVYTTNFVVAETHALILSRLGRAAAAHALQEIDSGSVLIIQVNADDEQRAREIIRQYDDKDFTLIDAISFTVMERLGISHAFTFDRHFAQYGFVMLDEGAGV